MTLYMLKSIFLDRKRLISNVVTIGIALMFILLINGFISGVYYQAASYFKNSKADLYVGKSVIGIIGNNSVLKSKIASKLDNVKGVKSVSQILVVPMVFKYNGNHPLILIGYSKEDLYGGPWKIGKGRKAKNRFEIILDKAFAKQKKISLDQKIELFDKDFKVVGFSEGTSSFLNPLAFLPIDTLRDLTKVKDSTTYFLIKTGDPNKTTVNIRKNIDEVKVRNSQEMAKIDQTKLSNAMGPILNVMKAIAILVSVMIVGLALTATVLSRKKQIATLKAIGYGKIKIYAVLLGQGIIYCFVGLAIGLCMALLASIAIENAFPKIIILIKLDLITNTFGTTFVVALIASAIPARKILKVDPATAF